MSESDEVFFEEKFDEIVFTHVYEILNRGPGVLLNIDVHMHVPEVVTNNQRLLGLGNVEVK